MSEEPQARGESEPVTGAAPIFVRSFDGSEIAVRSIGGGPGTPVLFANAVGATIGLWKEPLTRLSRHRRWITWDHRGLFDSPPPATDRLDPGAQAADALAALAHIGVERFALVSWSNGSRIAFEIAAQHPERVQALVVVNGGHGQSIERVLRHLEPSSALPFLAGVAKHFSVGVDLAMRQLMSRPELVGLIRQSGVLGSSVNPAAVMEMLRGMAACDSERLLATFEAIAGNPATELLPAVKAPTLLIAGGSDRSSPRHMIDEMQSLIPQARVHIYENTSHYLPLECPERLADDIGAFLAEP